MKNDYQKSMDLNNDIWTILNQDGFDSTRSKIANEMYSLVDKLHNAFDKNRFDKITKIHTRLTEIKTSLQK